MIEPLYAIILNEEVINLLHFTNYHVAYEFATQVYGQDVIVASIERYPNCIIGSKYINGIFYFSDGVTPIPYYPTDREIADKALNDARLAHDRISELYEFILKNNPDFKFEFGTETPTVEYYFYLFNDSSTGYNKELIPDIGNLRDVILFTV